MKNKRFLCIILIVILIIPQSLEVYSATSSNFVTTFSASDTRIGDATLRLKKGFDFVETDSSHYNYELALTAATLSAQVYPAANGDTDSEILKKLGYDKVSKTSNPSLEFPVVSFAYKRLEKGKNVFAVVVRGTAENIDIFTDGLSAFSMFAASGQNIIKVMSTVMEKCTGKTLEQIKKEDNYFFFTGHSLGGAVANYMSINETVMSYVNSNKGKIYTYTFESPHTCVALPGMNPESMSNAFNFKVDGDIWPNVPFYMWSTTYGKDVPIKASELNDGTLRTLFVNSKVNSIDGNIGLHDTCLPLIYILDKAKKEGNDISWVFYKPNESIVFMTDSIKYLGTEYDSIRKAFPSGKLEHSTGSAPWVWSSSDSDISFQFWGGPGNNQSDNWYNWTSGPYPAPYGEALCHTIMSDAGKVFSGLYEAIPADVFISRLTLDDQYSLANSISYVTEERVGSAVMDGLQIIAHIPLKDSNNLRLYISLNEEGYVDPSSWVWIQYDLSGTYYFHSVEAWGAYTNKGERSYVEDNYDKQLTITAENSIYYLQLDKPLRNRLYVEDDDPAKNGFKELNLLFDYSLDGVNYRIDDESLYPLKARMFMADTLVGKGYVLDDQEDAGHSYAIHYQDGNIVIDSCASEGGNKITFLSSSNSDESKRDQESMSEPINAEEPVDKEEFDYDKLYRDYAKKLQSESENPLCMKIFNSDEPMLVITDGAKYRAFNNEGEGYLALSCDIYQYSATDEKIVRIGKFSSDGTARPIRWRGNSIQTSTHHHAWSLSAKDGIGYVNAAHNVRTDNANVAPEKAKWILKNAEWKKTESESITKSEGEQLWDEYYGNGEILFFDPVQ